VPLAALAVVTAVFVSGALGASGKTGDLSGKNVGVIICTNQNPFCAAWANSVKSGLEKQGASVTVLSSVFDPAVDAQNMNRLIADKPDLIISVPASASAIVPSYIRAQRAGIPILGAIGRQSAAGAKIVTAEARTDDPALGRYAAMNLVEGMKRAGYKTGNVIALTGTASQNNVTDRMATFKAYMKKYPQYKIVAIEDTNWDQATSAKVAQQLLSKYASKGGIQGAYGMADNMAIGILQGAKQAGVKVGVANKGLVVTGSNCLAVGIKAIKAGQQYGTATQAPQVEAALAVKVGTQILNGQTVPKVSYVKESRITKANVAAFTKVCTF
jgi:ABC-type sugar transport system substrate-binding protein